MAAQGFSNFTSVALDGTKSDAAAGGKNTVVSPVVSAAPAPTVPASSGAAQCGGTTLVTVTRDVSIPISYC